MSYQDQWTRFHDKPTNGTDPSSNNGFMYTAEGIFLSPDDIDMDKVFQCYLECRRSLYPVRIDRNPGQLTPPLSKDEAIALASLGLLTRFELEQSHWQYCNLPEYEPVPITVPVFVKAVKALIKARIDIYKKGLTGSKKRNYIWENKILDAYPLAFRLPPEDIFYVKKLYNDKTNIFELVYFFLAACVTLIKDDRSSTMYLWLQLKNIYPKLADKLPLKKYVKRYFGTEHPFYKGLK